MLIFNIAASEDEIFQLHKKKKKEENMGNFLSHLDASLTTLMNQNNCQVQHFEQH